MSEHTHHGDGTVPGGDGQPILTPTFGCRECADAMERQGISTGGNLPQLEPTRWWRVVAPDGSLWCETGDETEARDRMRPGDVLWRAYKPVTTYEWRVVT